MDVMKKPVADVSGGGDAADGRAAGGMQAVLVCLVNQAAQAWPQQARQRPLSLFCSVGWSPSRSLYDLGWVQGGSGGGGRREV